MTMKKPPIWPRLSAMLSREDAAVLIAEQRVEEACLARRAAERRVVAAERRLGKASAERRQHLASLAKKGGAR
jgi:hypothetical protein